MQHFGASTLFVLYVFVPEFIICTTHVISIDKAQRTMNHLVDFAFHEFTFGFQNNQLTLFYDPKLNVDSGEGG
jgi:hypothetical protein